VQLKRVPDKESTMDVRSLEEAQLIAMFLTDGGICRQASGDTSTWRIFVTQKDPLVHQLFKEKLELIFGPQRIFTARPKNATHSYVNSARIAQHFLQYSASYRKARCNANPICGLLRGRKYYSCKECNPINFQGFQYPAASVPPMSDNLAREFLKYYFSLDGTITDRIQLTQRHPVIGQVQQLLARLDIDTSLINYYTDSAPEWCLRVKKHHASRFATRIGILPIKVASTPTATKHDRLQHLCRA
jgi:hypothetical protein